MCYKNLFQGIFWGIPTPRQKSACSKLRALSEQHREKEHKGNILSLVLYIDLFMGEIVTVFGICQALVAEGTMVDKILLKTNALLEILFKEERPTTNQQTHITNGRLKTSNIYIGKQSEYRLEHMVTSDEIIKKYHSDMITHKLRNEVSEG